MPRNIVGRPVRGRDFFDREAEQRRMWQRLGSGNNLLLLAPRRVGKTSLLYELRRNAWEEGWFAAYASVADAKDETGFLEAMVCGIATHPDAHQAMERLKRGPWKHYFEGFKRNFDEASIGQFKVKLRTTPPADWTELAKAAKDALPVHPDTRGGVLMLDEVPVFVMHLLREDPTRARARAFLTAFRDLRQGTAEQEGDAVHWILAGSIGLDTLARRHGLTAEINDLQPFELGPFSTDEADAFLAAVGTTEGFTLPADVRHRLCERAEWLIPHHLQALFAALRDRCTEAGVPPSVPLVDLAFEDLLGHGFRSYFDHWSVRLTEELGSPDDDYARRLLTVVAADPRGVGTAVLSQSLADGLPDTAKRQETVSWLTDALARDGYLVRDGERWRFRSPLLRGYWQRVFGD